MSDKSRNRKVELLVREAEQDKVGTGYASISRRIMRELGIKPGDIIEIEGKKKTYAIAWPLRFEDGSAIIKIDGIIRKNAGASLGDIVVVRPANLKRASRVVLAPLQATIYPDMANQIKYLIGKDLKKFYDDGKLILGICNGFQVLVKAGILPFYPFSEQKVSLALNTCARFIDTWVYLKVNKTNCIWTKDLPQIISLPIAHAEGRFCAEKEVISQIQSQIVFQYTDVNGEITPDANPNGSILNIAGITDREGRILGLMPHPERYSFSLQSPFWTEKREIKEEPGLLIFKNGVKFVKDALLS